MSFPAPRMRVPAAVVLLALPYLPFGAGWELPAGLTGGMLLALAGVGAPMAAGVLLSRAESVPGRIAAGLLAAVLLNLGALAGWRLFGAEPTAGLMAMVLGALTVAAGAVGAARGGSLGRWHPAGAVIGIGAFLLFVWAGTAVVPALEDQDGEVQGTANGLVRDLSPLSLTNRNRLHFFAHPPLSHVFAAVTLTLAGDLETVRPPYDAAREERASAGAAETARGPAAIVRAFRNPEPPPDRGFLWASRVFTAFRRDPALAGTRAPNFLLGALTAWLVFAGSRRLGAGVTDAALAAAAYATLPEILVRSAYGGYYAATTATLTAAVWLAHERAEPARRVFGAGAVAALVNHKAILLGAAATLPFRRGGDAGEAGGAGTASWFRLPALWLGLAAGAGLFWIWGLFLAPGDFVGEHLLDHGLRRFSGGEVLTRSGTPVYPSRWGLWGEFAAHFGPWVLVAAAGWIAGLVAAFGGAREATAAGWRANPDGVRRALTLWVLAGAVLFTLTDWRQTKHLCLLVPALAVLGAVFPAPGRLGLVRRAVWLTAIGWNLVWIVRLARDFGAMTVTPLW